jgi:hypothetical protein
VHIAIRVMDVLIIGLALVWARMLRLWFFYIAVVGFGVLVLMRLHYGLNYPWAFVGKYAVNIVIPLVMAWAGNHLAAKSSETETEKRLWQALFISLTILALGGSFWVLDSEEQAHQTEMKELRAGIKGDFFTSLLQYNSNNPQHQLTSDQVSQIVKGALGGKLKDANTLGGKRDRAIQPDDPRDVKVAKLAAMPKNELAVLVTETTRRMREYDLAWPMPIPPPDDVPQEFQDGKHPEVMKAYWKAFAHWQEETKNDLQLRRKTFQSTFGDGILIMEEMAHRYNELANAPVCRPAFMGTIQKYNLGACAEYLDDIVRKNLD